MRMSKWIALASIAALGACSGSAGPQGPQGPSGTNGTNGTPGATGPQGPAGTQPQLAEQCAMCHGAQANLTDGFNSPLVDVATVHNAASAPLVTAGAIQITSVTLPASTSDATPSTVSFTLYGPDCGPPLPNSPAPTVTSTCAPMDLQNTPAQVTTGGAPVAPFVFTVAKLAAAPSVGENPFWVPYLKNGAGLPIAEQTYAPSSNPIGTLAHVGTGQYTYTFKTAFGSVSSYDPTVTNRVGIQTHNELFANGTYDLLPSSTPGTAGTQVTTTPEIITTAACNQCHKLLKEHGNWRILTEYCVTCHNPSLTLTNTASSPTLCAGAVGQSCSGNLAVMVHEFHGAKQLGLPYVFNGLVGSTITTPQDIANCATCHQNLYTTPSTALNTWNTNPSFTACFTCHTVSSHPFAVDATANCANCHSPSGATVSNITNVVVVHGASDVVQGGGAGPFLVAQSQAFQFKILSVTNTAPGQNPVVKLAVFGQPGCPTTPPASISTPSTTCNVTSATGPFVNGGRIAVDIGFLTTDFQNLNDGQSFGQPVSLNALTGVANTTDFSVTVTSPTPVPSTPAAPGAVVVAIEGEAGVVNNILAPATTTPDRIPIQAVALAYAVGASPGSGAAAGSGIGRRVVVDVAKCSQCHEYLTLHGNNRTPTQPSAALPYGDVTLCTMCHNPEATDGSQRPAGSTTQTPIDFKVMIHAIHSASTTVWGFGGSVNDFTDVTYPAPLSDCMSCHITPPTGTFPETYTYNAPNAAANGTTTFTANTDLVGHTDNLRTTKWTAVCLGCHQSQSVFDTTTTPDATRLFLDHMIVNGAGFDLTQPQINALNTP